MSKDSISTKQDLDDFNEVTAQFVNYFLYNRSFKMGCDIQNSRCGTQLFEINSSEFTTVIESEDFEGRGVTGNKDEPFIYFRVPEKIIFNDERLDALFIKQNFLGKVIDIKTLNKYIDITIDIFFVGKKIPSDEIILFNIGIKIITPTNPNIIDGTPPVVSIIASKILLNLFFLA